MTDNKTFPLIIKVIQKIIIFLILLVVWVIFAVSILQLFFEESTDYYNSDAYKINACDEYYYEKEYDELFEFMNLYETYDEMYDVYWEVMDAYVDLQEYKKWASVSETDMEDAGEMAALYKSKVIAAAENCRFPQNQKYLDGFVEMLSQ